MELLAAVVLVAVQLTQGVWSRNFEVVYQWKVVNYATPPSYPSDPGYMPETTLFSGLEVTSDRIFLMTPKILRGVPASLSFIPRSAITTPDSPPALQAYPNWSWHAPAVLGNILNCNTTLVSVFRITRDKCNRLWVLDSGVLESSGNVSYPCRPKILIFDLATDRLIKLVTLPPSVVADSSLTTNIVLDDQNYVDNTYGNCNSVFAYITDTLAPALIIYELPRNRFWRLEHPAARPDPRYGNVTIENESFTLMDGAIGMAISGTGPTRCLYVHPFAGLATNCFPTITLQRGPYPVDPSRLPVYAAFNKSSQALGMVTDPLDGSIIYNQITRNTIIAWNPLTKTNRFLAYSLDDIKPVSDFKLDNRNRDVIWFVTTRLQKYFTGTVNADEINLRLMKIQTRYFG